jgi:hypothetical protein
MTGSIVAVQVVAGAAAPLPLLPAVPPVLQVIVTLPQAALRVQTARAAIAAPSAGDRPEISTWAGGLVLFPHATRVRPAANANQAARMAGAYPNRPSPRPSPASGRGR